MVNAADQGLQPGEMIDEFRILRILGAGNFGIVYEAENIHLDETVAIKEFLPTELARREADGQIRPLSPATAEAFQWARERFLQEARTLWGLGHPHPHPSIVRVTRYREANGSAYMFMEFEHGLPLSDLLDQRGTLPYAEIRPMLASLLDGLERVHAANILHRDIKPANILIRPDGSPVFIDFGAARNVALNAEISVFTTFTPRYAAIEQHDQSGRQGPWTDLYALGATIYRAVTGITPKSASEQLLGQPQETALSLGQGRYPDAFLHAIDLACALRPEERPQSVAAWRQLLFGGEPVATEATIVISQVSATDVTRLSTAPSQVAPFGGPARASGPQASRMPSPAASPLATDAALPRPDRKRSSPWGWIALMLGVILLSGVAGWLWWTRQPTELWEGQRTERPLVGAPGLPAEAPPAGKAASAKPPPTASEAPTRPVGGVGLPAEGPTSLIKEQLPAEAATSLAKEKPSDEAPRSLAKEQLPGEAPRSLAKEQLPGEAPRSLATEQPLVAPPTPGHAGTLVPSEPVVTPPVVAPPVEAPPVVTPPVIAPPVVTPRALEPLRPGEGFADPLKVGGTGPAMRVIPAGEGPMGSPAEEIGHREDERLYRAKVAAPFAMSQTEITLGQFGRFVEVAGYRTEADRESACLRVDDRGVELVTDLSLSWNSPGYPVSDQNPVVCVTWNDANAYATWLSEQTGRTYRLPTEEEWEYAARGGTLTSRYWGEDPKDACYNANTADQTVLAAKGDSRRIEGARVPCRDGHLYTAPVGTYAANPWGLKDMIGNVAEWTCSVYDSGYGGAQGRCLDTRRRMGPAPMVLRGGSCLSSPDLSRSAARDGLPSNLSLNTIGFRVLATEQPWTEALARD